MKAFENMAKTYEPSKVEKSIYANWMEKGYFHAEVDKNKTPFTIVIPPPNITGQLHMGHALDNTLQDTIIRFKRMQGFSTLWLPGTDHASIATEAKIVDALAKEGLTKEDLGREKFLERAWAWKNVYGNRIVEQLKCLGSSCDWERERFTMDEGLSKAVLEVFLRLYKKGLIYKGERITNWCPKCNTSISDIEVEYKEMDGSFWYINYPLADGSGSLMIATTRPETLLGDTAVAVNPEDEKYKDIIGKKLILPLVGKEIPVIADDYVELGFGTGAVKITPAHDPNDFKVGMRHNLEVIRIMNDRGIINENGGKYEGLDRYEARKQIVNDLEEQGFLVKTEPYKHNVGTCQRCGTVIEPVVSCQWYVKMQPLAEPAIEAVRSGKIKFIPERFANTYYNWMENIQDWCISRQLWWGHRIPAYYCQECGHMEVAAEMPSVCPKCSATKFEQDPDTLDTWFSSALWPFSTLGWPEKTPELDYFYPTDVLVTGYDIIFFWVARMIFSGCEQMKEVPFKHVLIHGLVRDSQGRKMSKSLGNGIDPLEIIDQYGTDALRFSLVTGNSPGNDQRFLDSKVESARNFANKIWNATRFVLMNFDDEVDFSRVNLAKLTVEDKWILSSMNKLVSDVTENLNKYELGVALQKLYDFIWDQYCDWYIELVKPRLFDSECDTRIEAQYVLNKVLVNCMKLLHPFMPFITEEIYQNLDKDCESIMISKWPEFDETLADDKAEAEMNFIIESIKSMRNIRTQMNVPPSKKAAVIFVTAEDNFKLIEDSTPYIKRLGYASNVLMQTNRAGISDDAASSVVDGAEIFIPLEELIDFEKELARLEKELATVESELGRVRGKLNNQGFMAKAPEKLVAEERAKLEKYESMYESTKNRIDSLKSKM
ncbi:MAG: valine--tRNA ligase [Ruminococcaceae bacterium]|nr:valine--tRNA ligase [Oscillospiraceae bacterium]